MPTTSPSKLNNGPPELPGFIATSVWMKGTYVESEPLGILLPFALTMPEVTENLNWKGDPIATTHSPTLRLLDFPIFSLEDFQPLF